MLYLSIEKGDETGVPWNATFACWKGESPHPNLPLRGKEQVGGDNLKAQPGVL